MMTLEICVDSVESARAAVAGGATRLELCGNLIIGGTSPSPYLIEAVQKLDVPVRVLLRPRFGDFLYTPSEQEILYKEVELCRSLGVDGVVIGALCPDGTLDVPFLSSLVEAAGPLGKTLHRAVDLARYPGQPSHPAPGSWGRKASNNRSNNFSSLCLPLRQGALGAAPDP